MSSGVYNGLSWRMCGRSCLALGGRSCPELALSMLPTVRLIGYWESLVATIYRLTPPRRMLNCLVTVWLRLGLPPARYHLLLVPGRKSGRTYSTPVAVMQYNAQRWLVAPYGEREWVKNARVAGQVVLRRGRRSESVAVREELDPAQSAPVLKRYITVEPITRKFFRATHRSPTEEFIEEAPRHPVFRILKS